MVWPVTNCSPIMRSARSTPLRISGSPPRPMRRVMAAVSPPSELVAVSLPVISRPQVAALTNSEGELPRCACQSAVEILSRISASRVAESGMRSSASARHISAMPSWLESEYSWISPATLPPPSSFLRRSATTSSRASSWAARASAGGRLAASSSGGRHSVSAGRQAAVMRARSAPCGRTSSKNSWKGAGAAPASWLGTPAILDPGPGPCWR